MTPSNSPSDHSDQLDRLLHDAVSDVEPRRGIGEIQARTRRPARSRRTWAWATGGAVLATAVTIAAVAMLGGSPGTSTARPGPAASNGTPTEPPASATERPVSGALPVYFVGDTGRGPRLFREFHRRDAAGFTLDRAVEEAVAGRADDPDYGSPWPEGTTLERAQLSDGVLSVDLSGVSAHRPTGMPPETAELALQQLVRTAQAVVQQTVPVTFLLGGRPTDTLLGVPTGTPVKAASDDEVLASVSISSPGEATRVHSPFTVEGRAAAFEANVQWELKQGGAVVRQGFTTAEECCTLAPYSFEVTAPAGSYTLVVHDEDPSGGEGLPPAEDTKQIEVE